MSTPQRLTLPPVDEPLIDVAERRYDPDGTEQLVEELVEAIAEAEGMSEPDFLSPPLYESVDVGALEKTLFRDSEEYDPSRVDGLVRFRYLDYVVTVEGDGRITVYAPPSDEARARAE